MSGPALSVSGLSKSYDGQDVLKGVNFEVAEGEVLAVLGPNGAGKTTTFRLIAGLARPSEGDVAICGVDLGHDRRGAIRNLGALIEGSGTYKHLTAWDNLRVQALTGGIEVTNSQIDESLEAVDLTVASRKRVSTFSTGMVQRLGVAGALLGAKPIIILDEPTAGLDPGGVRRMRSLVRELHDEGRTLIISSHQLDDIEDLADRVVLIDQGRVCYEGDLTQIHAEDEWVEVTVASPSAVEEALRGIAVVNIVNGARVEIRNASLEDILSGLAKAGIYPTELKAHRLSLEELFFQITDHHPGQ